MHILYMCLGICVLHVSWYMCLMCVLDVQDMHIRVYICMCTHTHTHKHKHAHAHTHTRTHSHTHTHTHTHTAKEAAPDDAAIISELSKAEKDLKKNLYGW